MKYLVKLWVGIAGLAIIGILIVVFAQREQAEFRQQIEAQIQPQPSEPASVLEAGDEEAPGGSERW